MARGNTFRQAGDPHSAVAAHQQAREIIGEPQDTSETAAVGLILANLGNAFQDSGDAESALASFDASIQLWGALIEGGEAQFSDQLAESYQQRANALLAVGAYEDAVAGALQAVQLYRALLASGRRDLRLAFARVLGAYSLGLERTFELAEARVVLDESIVAFAGAPGLVEDQRANLLLGLRARREDLVEALDAGTVGVGDLLGKVSGVIERADSLIRQGEPRAATVFLEDALGWLVWQQWSSDSDDLRSLVGRLCTLLGFVAGVYRGVGAATYRGSAAVGLRAFAIGISSLEPLARSHGGAFVDSFAKCYGGLAAARAGSGDLAGAESALDAMSAALGSIDAEKRDEWLAAANHVLSAYRTGT